MTCRHGDSTFTQTLSMTAGSARIDIAYDIDFRRHPEGVEGGLAGRRAHPRGSASEIQLWHVRRPVHQNTSWDAARFEF
ncbi:MAG: hypothetical protein IPN02_10200 [Candidatus Microthrix sp.]|uniref:Glycosyl hydrolase family 38 C-terminal domain-containing protein n=1 Tax=Candidatus Neomicrothrix subdominans TaxID=2954438 RepID=A0A936NBF8_9ACTN|nr:hypothetical protein [Candidatus Microthrix subdominans]